MTSPWTTIRRSAIPFLFGATLAVVATQAVGTSQAQQQAVGSPPVLESPIKRTMLVEAPTNGADGKKLVVATAELAPGAVAIITATRSSTCSTAWPAWRWRAGAS